MVLRFGLFVLVLAIDGIFAEQRLPEVLSVNLVSSLERIPHLRRGFHREHHASVESFLPSKLHRSLDVTKATCAWNEEGEDCSISISSQKHLLERSETEYAKLLVERLTCMEKTNETDCRSVGPCYFNEVAWKCVYKDIRRNHEDSPCAKVAPLYFDWREARTQCRKEDSSERCNSKRLCQWDSDYQYCSYDEYFIFYGIKNFTEQLDQVPDMYDRLKTEYEAPESGDNFTWHSILHYKISSIECPSGVEQLVCDYVVASTISFIGMEFYCPIKYASNASKCDADFLCEWRASTAECQTNDLSYYFAEKISNLRVFIPSMSEGADRKIRKADYTCELTFKRNKCKGNCIWNPNIGCRTRKDYVAALLTESGKNTTDALCTYLKTDGFSYCHTQFSERKCERNKLCRMLPFNWCEPKEESYLASAADEDPKLKRRYKRFKKQCWSRITEEECDVD